MSDPYHSSGYNKTCKTRDGRKLRPSLREHQCNLKLTAEEIQTIKALARSLGVPMNEVVARAVCDLFDANPVPFDD